MFPLDRSNPGPGKDEKHGSTNGCHINQAVCGYCSDGPEGRLAFGPRMQQDSFRDAFATAEGWDRFSQSGHLSK